MGGRQRSNAGNAQEVRIIGGKWKGRKLRFPGHVGIRPTLGRVRETLFNWIRPHINGASCLDLYAGSGILGIEALSQGASLCTTVERDRDAFLAVRKNAEALGAHLDLRRMDSLEFLRDCTRPYDFAFVDPPYGAEELLRDSLRLIAEKRLVNKLLYAEGSSREILADLAADSGFDVVRETRAGRAHGALLELRGPQAEDGSLAPVLTRG